MKKEYVDRQHYFDIRKAEEERPKQPSNEQSSPIHKTASPSAPSINASPLNKSSPQKKNNEKENKENKKAQIEIEIEQKENKRINTNTNASASRSNNNKKEHKKKQPQPPDENERAIISILRSRLNAEEQNQSSCCGTENSCTCRSSRISDDTYLSRLRGHNKLFFSLLGYDSNLFLSLPDWTIAAEEERLQMKFIRLNDEDNDYIADFKSINPFPICYSKVSNLGMGNFGVVAKVKDAQGKFFAIKEQKSKNANFAREVLQMRKCCGNEHIVQCIEDFQNASGSYIVMEYVEGFTLQDVIDYHAKKNIAFTEDFLWKVISQLISGIYHIHKKHNIIHRDLKPDNIMFDKASMILKILDFGQSGDSVLDRLTTLTGTLIYMDPDVLAGERASEKSDIWSFGVIIYQMIEFSYIPKRNNNGSLEFSRVIDRKLVAFLNDCLSLNPQRRLTSEELIFRYMNNAISAITQEELANYLSRGEEQDDSYDFLE